MYRSPHQNRANERREMKHYLVRAGRIPLCLTKDGPQPYGDFKGVTCKLCKKIQKGGG